MIIRFLVATTFLLFSLSAHAESKSSGLADIAAEFAKKVKKIFKDDERVSQDEFMNILRSDNILCYELSQAGTCGQVEVAEIYLSNGFTYHSWSLTEDGYISSLLAEVEWDGDMLCDKEKVKRAYLSQSPSSVANIESFSGMNVSDEWKNIINNAVHEIYGDVKICYEYVRSKETPQVMLQLEYVDGVLQDPDDFWSITVFEKGNGRIDLHY